MRERQRDKGRLTDIVEYSDNIIELLENMTFEQFVKDKRTYYAVMKNVEVVGEAAYMLTKAFKKAHVEIPWNVVQGMRHVLVHDYANITSETLYDTAVNNIPELRNQVARYLCEVNWDEWAKSEDSFPEMDDSDREKNIELARKMKLDNISTELISKYTGLNAEEISAL
ncbi:MAG: DUF86 domain-containing protein [Bacteroidales bacterium]|nr:DUF86 domain-containing protein [Bacteroidales bacterium]